MTQPTPVGEQRRSGEGRQSHVTPTQGGVCGCTVSTLGGNKNPRGATAGVLSFLSSLFFSHPAAAAARPRCRSSAFITGMNSTVAPIRWKSGSAMTGICAESTMSNTR